MQCAAINTEFSVKSDLGISLASWGLLAHADLGLMYRNDTTSNAKSSVVESRLSDLMYHQISYF